MATTRFNEQEYEYEIYLTNNEGANKFNINPNAIVNLDIEQSLDNWVIQGTLTTFFMFEGIENKPDESGILGDSGNNYTFNNDGSDTLVIRMFPLFDDLGLEIDRNHWEILHKFAIYDVEDIPSPPGAQNMASSMTKCKKFYFWDRMYQRLISNKLEYSTGLSTFPGLTLRREIPTGIAMKEVLEKALLDDGNAFFDLTYLTNLIGGPNNEWDEGASNIFYTAPTNTTAYDSLMYLYKKHVSSKGNNGLHDFCILKKERGPQTQSGDEGYFVLKPVSDFFKKAGSGSPGEYQIEHFYIQDFAPEESGPNPQIAPFNPQQDMQVDTKLGNYSLITQYEFVDISSLINTTDFCSYVVHSFDFQQRTFNIEYQQNSIESAREFIGSEYISNLRTSGKSSDKERLFLLNTDRFKQQNRNIKHVYSTNSPEDEIIERQSSGLQKILQTSLFQNACINFRVPGSTNRQPGRFIAIDKQEGVDENNFNYKFFGQWFIIKVNHIFEAGAYINDITAVKLHRFAAV